MTASVPAPTRNATQFVLPSTIDPAMAHESLSTPRLSIEKPNSLGNWLINTVSAIPFMYP